MVDEEEMKTDAPETPAAAPAKGKGMWIGIVVVVIVIVILLAAVFGGFFGAPPPGAPDLPEAVFHVGYPGDAGKYLPTMWANRAEWTSDWFFSEGLKDQSFIDSLDAQGIDVSQILGTAPTTSDDPSILASGTAFNENYTARFVGDTSPGLFASHAYDGLFLIALAMADANTSDVTTAAFKASLRSVSAPPGTVIRPGEWAKALVEIGAGRDIDFVGASGAVNFDSAGEVLSDYEVWGVNATTGTIERRMFIAEGSWNPAPPLRASLPPEVRDSDPPRPLLGNVDIGVLVSFTGALAVYGPDIYNGTVLGMEQINADGGLWGGNIVLHQQDDQTSPTAGATAAGILINTNNVSASIGSLASSVSIAAYDVAGPAGVLMMSPASTSPVFTTSDLLDLFWRTAPSDALQGRAAALYAYETAGWRKVSVFHISNAYGDGLGSVFEQGFEARGGSVMRNIGYVADQASYDSELAALFTPGSQPAPPLRVRREDLR